MITEETYTPTESRILRDEETRTNLSPQLPEKRAILPSPTQTTPPIVVTPKRGIKHKPSTLRGVREVIEESG